MSNKYPGTFVTCEGIDGAGKSTVVEAIEDHYGEDEVVTTSEPSDYWTGDAVYRAIDSESETPALADFFLFMGDRVQHIENRIIPALKDDKIVVSDRFSDSTWAYQRQALIDEFDEPWKFINEVMCPWNLEPDITLFLDISVDEAMDRFNDGDKYEKREFLEEVRTNYKHINAEFQHRFVSIDAEQSKEQVQKKAIESIEEWD